MNDKQRRFCEEYMIDLNATQAAVRAGYSAKSGRQQGTALMSSSVLRAYIGQLMAERSKRTGVNADRVLLELARIGFVNPSHVIDVTTATVQPGASVDDLAAISSIKVKTFPTAHGDATDCEVKLHDKIKALEKLGEHLGMWGRNRGLSEAEVGTGVVILPEILAEKDKK